jgi:hypothetical protein
MRKIFAFWLLSIVSLSCYANGAAGEEALEEEAVMEMTADEAGFNPNLDFAQVVSVTAGLETGGSWNFAVTVRHNDEGWGHYANLWEVVDPETSHVYGRRVLAHPHDSEQPFTRNQRGIVIPTEVTLVLVRARCTDHGFEGKAVLVDLGMSEGKDFKVIR